MWHRTKPKKHPELVALSHNANDEISLKVPNKAGEKHTTMVTAMPDTGLSICLIDRCVTMQMGITRHDLAKTTKQSSQLVYVTPKVTCLFSPRGRARN